MIQDNYLVLKSQEPNIQEHIITSHNEGLIHTDAEPKNLHSLLCLLYITVQDEQITILRCKYFAISINTSHFSNDCLLLGSSHQLVIKFSSV